jgi:hypothetical protein
MLWLTEAKDAEHERTRQNLAAKNQYKITFTAIRERTSPGKWETYLSQSELITTTEERTLALGISQKRFNLLHNTSNQLLRGSIAVSLRGRSDTSEEVRDNLAEECVDEEGQACAVQRVVCRARSRDEVRGVCIGEELRDDAGLGDDVAVVRETGDKATLYARKIRALFPGVYRT